MYEHDQYALPDSSVQSVIVPLSAALFSQGCNSTSDPIHRAQPSSPRDNSSSSCNTSCTTGVSPYCHVLDPVIQSVHQQPQQQQLLQRRKSDSDAASSPRPSSSSISSIVSPLSNHSSEPVSPNSIINRVSEVSLREDGYASGVSGVSSELNSNFSNGSPLNCSSVSGLSTTDSEALQSDKEWNDSRSVRRGRPKLSTTPVYSPCMICGDRSTGKHYGAFSCDGCKGFFRRSIRKNQMYTCRFTRECNVTKDRRNQCRHCRLRKCVNAGMKKEAVQNERDRISHRRLGGGEMPPSPAADGGLSVDMLMDAENHCRQTAPTEQRLDSERQIASVNDVAQSVKQQLLVLVEWAKAIPSFAALKLEDRIKLLKAHSGEHLLLGIAWRSRSTDGYLLLGNDKLIPRLASGANVPHGRFATAAELSVSNINWIASRVLDDIVRPLLTLSVDEKEFMCLRTMIFFDPMLHGLEDPNAIHTIRLQAQLLLEDYIADRQDVSARSRFGQIMFMLPYLQTISTAMIHQIQVTKMDGFTEVDTLISEMLLGSLHDEEKEFYHNVAVSPILSPRPLHRPIIIRTDQAYSKHQDCPVRHTTYGEPCDLSYHHNHNHDNSTHHYDDNNTHHHERHQPTRLCVPDSVNSVRNFSDEPLMEEMSPSRRNSQGSSIDEKCSSLQPGISDYRVVVLDSRSPHSEQDGEMDTSDYNEVVNHLNLSRKAEHSYSDTVEQSIKLGFSSRPNHTGNLNSSELPGRYESVNRGRILLSSPTTSDCYFEEMTSEPYDLSPGDHSPYSAYGASRSSGGRRSQGIQQQPLNLQQVPD